MSIPNVIVSHSWSRSMSSVVCSVCHSLVSVEVLSCLCMLVSVLSPIKGSIKKVNVMNFLVRLVYQLNFIWLQWEQLIYPYLLLLITTIDGSSLSLVVLYYYTDYLLRVSMSILSGVVISLQYWYKVSIVNMVRKPYLISCSFWELKSQLWFQTYLHKIMFLLSLVTSPDCEYERRE